MRTSQQSGETEIKMRQSSSWFNMPHLHKVIQHHSQFRDIIYWNSLFIFIYQSCLFFSFSNSMLTYRNKHIQLPFVIYLCSIWFSYFLCSFFILCVSFTYSRYLDPRCRLKIQFCLYVQDHISTINKAKIVPWKINIWIHFYPHDLMFLIHQQIFHQMFYCLVKIFWKDKIFEMEFF